MFYKKGGELLRSRSSLFSMSIDPDDGLVKDYIFVNVSVLSYGEKNYVQPANETSHQKQPIKSINRLYGLIYSLFRWQSLLPKLTSFHIKKYS